jgi:hypothetical protein
MADANRIVKKILIANTDITVLRINADHHAVIAMIVRMVRTV